MDGMERRQRMSTSLCIESAKENDKFSGKRVGWAATFYGWRSALLYRLEAILIEIQFIHVL